MKKYIEIYDYYKKLILSKQMNSNDKMPSVRKAAEIFDVSKTTIQNAYFSLQADGYIIANPKSGYYISEIDINDNEDNNVKFKEKTVKYDLKSGDADKDSFDIALWQRYIKNALRNRDRLLSYGEPQGEQDLREVLAQYIREKRNVVTSSDRIVIGAGVQALFNILCPLMKGEKRTVSFPDNSFKRGIAQFSDYGFEVHTRYKDADVIYVSPSHMTAYGDVMPIKRRLELVKHSEEMGSLVIEDDFDNDFLYQTKPTPSLFALSKAGNVVYMGSFSNVLIPGIRISFMVLTKELTELYHKNIFNYAQTASKTEQIALCGYIRDGHIKSQTRKIRRLYTAKAKSFCDILKAEMPNAKFTISENGLQIKAEVLFNKDINVFEKNQIAVNITSYEHGLLKMVLIPSSIETKDLKTVAKKLKEALMCI